MGDDFVAMQMRQMYLKETGNFRYIVVHRNRGNSFFNYYPTKFSAYMEAIRPKYWKYNTVVMLEAWENIHVKPKLDMDSWT